MRDITDNTMLTNGVVTGDTFYPKKNLPSGTLRIILTNSCNFQCKYCFNEGEKEKNTRCQNLDELKRVINIGREFGINSIKLTGGEPLLYPKMEELLKYLDEINMPYYDLTTNISLLNKKNIDMLNKYHVSSLTLSLNTFDKEKYEYLSGFSNFNQVMENLDYTINNFKGKLRINCIVFDEKYHENDYFDILVFCKKHHLGLRFVEPSKVEGFPITYTKDSFNNLINELREVSTKVIKSDCNSVEYLFFGNWYLTVMHSLCDNKLCDNCKEYMYIRLTSEGKFKPCLKRCDTEVEVDYKSDEGIKKSYVKAINNMGLGINE